MTDNEIIKALECCRDAESVFDCQNCPYIECTNKKGCITELHGDILDIINRQKAEIERLRNTVKTDFLTVTEKLKLSQSEISEIRTEAIKEFAKSISRLSFSDEENGESMMYLQDVYDLVEEMTVNYESSKQRKDEGE